MWIVGGIFRSRRIAGPEGNDTRPTLDRVREAVFSALLGHVEEASVLDLFGGSGAYALEALSRGASSCVINDQSSKAVKVIRRNISSLQVEGRASVLNLPYAQALSVLEQAGERFSLVFLDPPYHHDLIPRALELMDRKDLCTDDAVFVCETQTDEEPGIPEGYAFWKKREYGTVRITYLVRKQQKDGEQV